MTTQKPTFEVVLSEELLEALEAYRFRRRFGSRGAALRFLLRYALAADPEPGAGEARPLGRKRKSAALGE